MLRNVSHDSPEGPEDPWSPRPPCTRRERARAATIDEIKATALGLMREQGPPTSGSPTSRGSMGMTPPALYRYFADRDELLTASSPTATAARRRGRRRPATAPTDGPGRPLGGRRAALPRVGAQRAAAVRADPRHAGARLRRPPTRARPPRRRRRRWRSSPACSSRPPTTGQLGAAADPRGLRGRSPPAQQRQARRAGGRHPAGDLPGDAADLGDACTASSAWRPTATSTGSSPTPATRCSTATSGSPRRRPGFPFRRPDGGYRRHSVPSSAPPASQGHVPLRQSSVPCPACVDHVNVVNAEGHRWPDGQSTPRASGRRTPAWLPVPLP